MPPKLIAIAMSHLRTNAAAWDRLVRSGSVFAKVATDEECAKPLKTLDSRGWLPLSVEGMEVLCLAAGGGWQSILYAAAGAKVTVVDLSDEMLNLDQREADQRGYQIECVRASMDSLEMLGDGRYDIVHQPVSTCYIPKIVSVYREVARVLKVGGSYISQHKQPTSQQVSGRTRDGAYIVGLEYYRDSSLPQTDDQSYREPGTTEFLHRWDQLIGELCRAGFVLEDLTEPYRVQENAAVGHWGHRARYVPPYVRLKARRVKHEPREASIWTP
ncbi:class I SAM-dependent methyltransferase [Calycomorphotria hydatis]|uniref:class I SAM-dependent methyltransferase n=1 Tax=Calycomorphotria hydatis TaxID=2528027 RepID=UPI001E2D7944|nr:class I SAM-dependent methyltransferase [Calycomorphotria hydatis]